MRAKDATMIGNHRDWKHKIRASYKKGKVVEYSIAFYRIHESGWYDEIRHDSHEAKKGRDVVAPHFHMKLRCSFKDSLESGIEQIRSIVDNYLEALREAIH